MDGPRPRHREADRRDARWAHLGSINARKGFELSDGLAYPHRDPPGQLMMKRILGVEDQGGRSRLLHSKRQSRCPFIDRSRIDFPRLRSKWSSGRITHDSLIRVKTPEGVAAAR